MPPVVKKLFLIQVLDIGNGCSPYVSESHLYAFHVDSSVQISQHGQYGEYTCQNQHDRSGVEDRVHNDA